jgi:hypothetical protein
MPGLRHDARPQVPARSLPRQRRRSAFVPRAADTAAAPPSPTDRTRQRLAGLAAAAVTLFNTVRRGIVPVRATGSSWSSGSSRTARNGGRRHRPAHMPPLAVLDGAVRRGRYASRNPRHGAPDEAPNDSPTAASNAAPSVASTAAPGAASGAVLRAGLDAGSDAEATVVIATAALARRRRVR